MRHTRVFRAISAALLLSLSGQLLAQTTQYATTQYAYEALGRRTQVQTLPAAPGGSVPTTLLAGM